jgi:hypothetical protein
LPVELAVVGQPTGLTRSATLIGDLRIVQMHGEGQCERLPRSQRRERCFALQTNTDRDAIVFVLYHQQNNGLVRLADQRCSSRAAARVARQQETLLVPLPIDAGDAARWSTASDWLIEPDTDTFYVVATGHTQAARALAAHFGQLPQRCGNSLRPGLETGSLRQWFRDLHAIADHRSGNIDWQSVRIRDGY